MSSTLRQAAQQALEALEYAEANHGGDDCYADSITALKAALAEEALAEPIEPVAWMNTEDGFCTLDSPVEGIDVMSQWVPLYASPPQPEERNFCSRCGKRSTGIHTCTPPAPLTDEVIADLWHQNGGFHHHFARAIERWLKGNP